MTGPCDGPSGVDDAPAEPGETRYELTLYVSGASEFAARAVTDVRRLCDRHLPGRHELCVVDVHNAPAATTGGRVLATPTLVRTAPLPVRQLVGDLSDTARVLAVLELTASDDLTGAQVTA